MTYYHTVVSWSLYIYDAAPHENGSDRTYGPSPLYKTSW